MPKGDRTGPMGAGAKSGRAAGYCAGFNAPGYVHAWTPDGPAMRMQRMRRGWCDRPGGSGGRRQGFFASWRPWHGYFGGYPFPPQPVSAELETETLKHRSRMLKSELDAINNRLNEIAGQEKAP